MAVLTAGQADKCHQPLPDEAVIHAWRDATPRRCKNSPIVLVRFSCLSRTHRNLRRIQPANSTSMVLHFAKRKYAIQPVRKLLSSPTISSISMPRFRRVICRMRSLTRTALLGATPSSPPFRRRWPRNLRSSTCATALFSRLTRSRSVPSKYPVTDASTRSPAARDRT